MTMAAIPNLLSSLKMSDIVIREVRSPSPRTNSYVYLDGCYQVTNGVWTFSRPFARFGWIPFGGRSTAIKLKDGGVWLLASTPMSEETKAKLDELGPVK